MDAVAAKNPHCKNPGYHFMLAWPEGVHPGVEAVFALAEQMVGKLGLSEHQHVVAIHDDAYVRHCHVAINRVHPQTLKAVSVKWPERALRDFANENGSAKASASRHRLGVLRWSPLEALEQACAALPDSGFSDRYGIPRDTINKLQDVVSDMKSGQGTDEVWPALLKARQVLPKAWPEEKPQELFEALDRSIAEGYRRRLEAYPDGLRIGERYDTDKDFADVVNGLVPGFEYPDWSHRTVKDVQAVAEQQARESTLRSLAALDVGLVDTGRYIGKVVDADNGIVVQDAGRGAMVAHDARKWDVAPKLGEQLDVTYTGGRAHVVRQSERELAAAGQGR
ncbi:Protein TraI [Rhodocyclaceae bacterium]|nr:Protein TraI [Rhodocyclaceae bacterium]